MSRLAVFAAVCALAACTPSAQKAPVRETGAPTASAEPASVAEAGAPAAPQAEGGAPSVVGKKACTKDADCRTHASYCAEAPCACLVLGADDPDPKCRSPHGVQCLVDPCMKKAAACQSGTCVLTPK